MKRNIVKFLAVCVGCFLCLTATFAQNAKRVSSAADSYVISAKAGVVNFVDGKVAVVRKKGKSGYLLKGDRLEAGDKVLTGGGGKAEILLNPGSFVRLAGNSEFEFITTSLDDLQIKLNGGSAIFEVLTSKEFRVAVNTPKSGFYIIKSGIYRVDALADGTAKIEVWKGRAQLADAAATTLKAGQTTISNGGQSAVAKFDRDDKDEFVVWSRDRAKELDKINAKLRSRELNRALISSYSQDRWNVSSSFGLWVRDPFSLNYCFLPFGYGYSSPYGHFYDRSVWNYQTSPNSANANNPNYEQPNGNSPNGNSPNAGNAPGGGFPGASNNNPSFGSDMPRPITDRPGIVERKSEPAMPRDGKDP